MARTPHNLTFRKAIFRRFDFDPAPAPIKEDTVHVSKLYVLDVEIKDTNKKSVINKLKDIIKDIEDGTYENEKIYKQNYDRRQIGKVAYNLYEFENCVLDKDEFHGYDD